jgi:Zn-dependent protease with chaperone function
MQGRLASEEWKPLLAASLIFYGQLRSQVTRRSALVFAPMLVLITALVPGLLIRNPIFSDLVVFTLTALVIATAVGGVYSSLLLSRKFMLLADRKAAEQFGSQAFLEVLRKIQSLKQSDEQEEKMSSWAWTEYGDAPGIEKRIRNLQEFS